MEALKLVNRHNSVKVQTGNANIKEYKSWVDIAKLNFTNTGQN